MNKIKKVEVWNGKEVSCGAGEGSVVEILVSRYGAKHISVREFLKEEATKRGVLLKDRDELRAFGELLQKEHGSSYIIRAIMGEMKYRAEGIFIIESLRRLGELYYLIDTFGDVDFTLIGVDAPVILRYGRCSARGTMTDYVDFDDFVRQEGLENEGTDVWETNLSACMEMVAPQFRIWNQWTTRYLKKRVREIADEIGLEKC